MYAFDANTLVYKRKKTLRKGWGEKNTTVTNE